MFMMQFFIIFSRLMIKIRYCQTLIRTTVRAVLTIAFNSTWSLSQRKERYFSFNLSRPNPPIFSLPRQLHSRPNLKIFPEQKNSATPDPKQKPFHLNHLS